MYNRIPQLFLHHLLQLYRITMFVAHWLLNRLIHEDYHFSTYILYQIYLQLHYNQLNIHHYHQEKFQMLWHPKNYQRNYFLKHYLHYHFSSNRHSRRLNLLHLFRQLYKNHHTKNLCHKHHQNSWYHGDYL